MCLTRGKIGETIGGEFSEISVTQLPDLPGARSRVTERANDPSHRTLARALLGWLREDEATRWLAGNEAAATRNPLHRELARRARTVVETRPAFTLPTDAVAPLPAEIVHHIDLLRAHPESGNTIAQMGEPRLIDLGQVIGAQKQIVVGEAMDRVAGAAAADLLGIARVTLPLPKREPISWNFDAQRNAFVLNSPNQNLRVVGHFNSTVGGETPGVVFDSFGFALSYQRSYMQVASIGGRLLLRDGYHRAYGLLRAGIRHVPAFVREFSAWEEASLPAGLLPPEVCLGMRPPMLTDYLDDAVAIDRWIPRTSKLIVLQAIELTVPA